MAASNYDYIAAHGLSIRHHDEVLRSELCGCFYCRRIFPPSAIENWVKDGELASEQTALCPYCGIDSVIGSAAGVSITSDLLARMNQYWFG